MKFPPHRFFLAAFTPLLVSHALAAGGTWTNPAGGSWTTAGNWASSTIASGADAVADFGTLNLAADATVTLDGARTVGGLVFGDTTPGNNWTLNPSSAGPLTLDVASGVPTITVNNQAATLGLVLAGTKGLTKAGAGTLTLTGANTYSGATVINAGTVNANNNAAFGTSTVQIGPAGAVVTANAIANTITGSGILTVNAGANTLAPSNAAFLNGFTGTLTINSSGSGKLALVNAGQNLGSGSTVNVASGATFYLTTGATVAGVTFNVSGTGNSEGFGALRFENITLAASSTVNLLSNVSLGGNGSTLTVAAPIQGSGFGFSKVGAGGMTLSAANTFTGGVSIGAGTLTLAHALALQNNTLTTGSALANSGLVFSPAVAGNAFTLGGLAGNGNLSLQNNANAAIVLSVGNNNADTTYSGAISGSGSLVKVGSGTLTLAGTGSTFTGTTTVSAGTLRLKGSPIFPNGMTVMPLGDSITYGASGTNSGYRGPLYNLIKNRAPGFLFVGSSIETLTSTTVNPLPPEQLHNEGHASYTINDINNNLDGLDSTTFNMYGPPSRDPNGGHWLDGIASGANARPPLFPDIITMMVGTNNASDSDRAAVKTQLHNLITKITTMRPNTKLIVAQITPSTRPNNVSYNAAVADEVAGFQAAGKHVTLVDMYTNFPGGGLSGDGTHPNDVGFNFMASQWYDGISAVAAIGKGLSTALSSSTALTVAAGATFDLDGSQIAVGMLSGAGAITLGTGGVLTTRSLTYTTSTFSGAISGAGSLTKIGGGTLVLSGANTYSGTTTVSSGTLQISGTLTTPGTIEVLSGATLDTTGGTINAGTVHIQKGGALTGTGTVNATVINDGAAAPLVIMPLGDSITAGGGSGLPSNQSGYRDRLFARLKAANVSFVYAGTTNVYQSPQLIDAGQEFHNGYGSQTLQNLFSNFAASAGLTGGANNNGGYWLTGGNPTNGGAGGAGGPVNRPAVFPDIVLLMAGTNDADYTTGASLTDGTGLANMQTRLHNILTWFKNNRPNTTVIFGLPIPFNRAGDADAAATDALVTAFNSWVVNTELPQFPKYRSVNMNALFRTSGGAINTALYADGIHPTVAGYAIMGEAWFAALQGLGVVPKWKGDNAANVWSVGGAANFSDFSGAAVAFKAGDTVFFDDAGSNAPAISLSGTLTPAEVTVSASKAYTFGGAGALGGTMTLVKSGTGTLTLATDNSFTGGVTINAGVLQIGAGGTGGTLGSGAVTDNATLAFNRSDTVAFANVIGGTGGVQQLGAGTTILTAANTYAGTTTIANGTLQVGNAGPTGSLGTGGVVDNANLAFNRSDNFTLSVGISGSGSLTKLGAGTLTLAAPQAYTGATIISGGTLRLQGKPSFLATGLLYRLAADTAAGYALNANGVNVDTFKDLGGNGANFTSGGTANGPSVLTGANGINGLGVLHFSGASINNKLTLATSTAPKTLFVVSRPSATQNALAGIWGQNGADYGIRLNSATAWQYSSGNGNDFAPASSGSMWIDGTPVAANANGSFTGGAPQILTVTNSNAATMPTTALGSYFTGSNRAFTGDIAEVLAYGAVLSPEDRQSVEAYLKYKWFGSGSTFRVLASVTAVNLTQSGAALDVNGGNQTIGSLTGVTGSKVYLGGAILTVGDGSDTTFAGTISDNGGASATTGGGLTKAGNGTLTLAGANTYAGPTQINAGTLRITGSLANASTIDVQSGAVLDVSAGTITATTVRIHAGGTLRGTGTINATVVNDGTIVSGAGQSLNFTGSVTNNQLIQLTGGSAFQAGGGVVNLGTLDIITGAQTLPAGLVNNGIILDASSARVKTVAVTSSDVTVSIQSYSGHGYKLQRSATLAAGSWQDVGSAQTGTGAVLNFTDARASGATAKNFYRIQVNP